MPKQLSLSGRGHQHHKIRIEPAIEELGDGKNPEEILEEARKLIGKETPPRRGPYPVDLKRAMAQVSVKSHENGAHNPKAHLRKKVSIEEVLAAPIVAYPLGLFDCCGVSDGSACAIITTPEIAKALGKDDRISVKSLQIAVSSGAETGHNSWDGDHFVTTAKASKRAYEEAGIGNPCEGISMMEVHDCFSITELVTMEDLFGASGLRMIYEMYLQLQGKAGERQLKNPRLGLHTIWAHAISKCMQHWNHRSLWRVTAI